MRRSVLVGVIFALLAVVAVGAAGTVTVTFPASADHNAVVNGVAVLSSYRVDVYSGTTVTSSKDCGKPVPVANVVTCSGVTVPSNLTLTVKAVAVGPGGESAGPASDPFGNAAAPAAPGKPTVQ